MSISEKLLKTIAFGSDLITEVDGLKYLPYKMIWGSDLRDHKRDSVQATISRVVAQGLVKKRIDEGKVYLALTEMGINFLNRKQSKAKLNLRTTTEKWDGVYRFILFDIPERDRFIRDSLRNALKVLGAVCWQKSVWVTRKNITEELNQFINKNGLDDYCGVLEVKEIYSFRLKKLLEQK